MNMKDKKEVAEIVLAVLKASATPEQKPTKKTGVKVSTTPKETVPSSRKPEILQKLTSNERVKIWGNLNKENIFSKKYSAAHQLYKTKGIEGRPNITYKEAWNEFIVPVMKQKKMTPKQQTAIKSKAVQQIQNKMQDNEEKQPRFWEKRNEWLQKGIEGIKSPPSKQE